MAGLPRTVDDAAPRLRLSAAWLWLFGVALIAWAIAFVVMTWHWPVVGDAALLRYSVFLIGHGWAPYRDFLDINMPGAYWATAVGMHLAPQPDASWRIFDIGLIALAGVGYYVIARPYSRFASLFATVLLLLVHGQDGVQQAGQRDLVIAVLLVLAVASLLEAVRQDRWEFVVPFGLAVGLAATIKPTAAPLGVVLLAMAIAQRLRWPGNGSDASVANRACAIRRWLLGAGLGIAAMLTPVAAMLLWLERKHALGAWWMTQRVMLPYYATLERRPLGFTLSHSISPLLPLVLLWLMCVVLRGPAWPRFERWLMVAATVLNVLGLLAQGKALPYQRYPMLAFLLPLMALDLMTAWRGRGVSRGRSQDVSRASSQDVHRGVSPGIARCVAFAGICCGCLVLAPLALVRVHRFDARPQEFDAMLEADLRGVGGNLNGRVQCLDTIQDCLPTLYAMRLTPATWVLSDLTLFGPAGAAVDISRQRFFDEIEARPPAAFVVVSGFFLDSTNGYRKLETWPAFVQWLNAHYSLAAERTQSHAVRWWGRSQPAPGYRLYVWRKGPNGE